MAKLTPRATYSDQELLDLMRDQVATISATGQSYDIRGKRLTRADLGDLMRSITSLENRVNAQTNTAAINLTVHKRR